MCAEMSQDVGQTLEYLPYYTGLTKIPQRSGLINANMLIFSPFFWEEFSYILIVDAIAPKNGDSSIW